MTDIVERLLDFDNEGVTGSDRFHLRRDAADEIKRLRGFQDAAADLEDRLEAALAEIERLTVLLKEALAAAPMDDWKRRVAAALAGKP